MTPASPAKAGPYNKANPFPATLLENRLLNTVCSEKETRHFVLNLRDSGLRYEPGNSLGVLAHNSPRLVEDLLRAYDLPADAPVPQPDGSTQPLGELLRTTYTLNRALGKFPKAIADRLPDGPHKQQLLALIADQPRFEEYIHTRDYIDIAREYPEVRFTPAELCAVLSKINPRLYSIASSPDKHPGEVHLTVSVIRYETHGRPKKGLCTGYLSDDAPFHDPVIPVFVAPSKHFHLPHDPATPIIMVGPGTGIAPFRAFLEHREVHGHPGKNWLFFGEQRRDCDFLYGEEFLAWQKTGLLTRLDTAFSRDQAEKIYVQDRLREHGRDIWDWMQNGACLYVCGDAKRMAKDVHQTLVDITVQYGGKTPGEAEHYWSKTLHREEQRYLRDVY